MTELRCADVEARLVDAVDGRLDPADSVRFHSHIEGCAPCRERAALWRGLVPTLREAAPPLPDAMSARRMQLAIERQLATDAHRPEPRRWRASWWVPALGLCAATAVALLWWRAGGVAPTAGPVATVPRAPLTPPGYATVSGSGGVVEIGNQAGTARAGARVPVGVPVVLAQDATLQVAIDGGAVVRVAGPARLQLDGTASAVALRLTSGRLAAEVTHRSPDQDFAVITSHVRVVVRGTRFAVEAEATRSRVQVSEGQVAVERAGHPITLVAAGESFDSTTPARPELPVGATAARPVDCADVTRSCRATARAVRASMRAGEVERALRLIGEARRGRTDAEARCSVGSRACEDELRYLNAEALNQAGRLDDAIAAYHALDGKDAPSAMRQNALFAAAQIEKRRGRIGPAGADFERALLAAPRGALYEEALIGAMESARDTGDGVRARSFARRYLAEFPRGLAAPRARTLVASGPPP